MCYNLPKMLYRKQHNMDTTFKKYSPYITNNDRVSLFLGPEIAIIELPHKNPP